VRPKDSWYSKIVGGDFALHVTCGESLMTHRSIAVSVKMLPGSVKNGDKMTACIKAE
jgi:hypothetical protein